LVVTVLIAGTSVLHDGAVLDVVQFTSTPTADVTFAWFAASSITDDMFSRAIAKKMPRLKFYVSNCRARKAHSNVLADPAYILLGRTCTLGAVIYEMLG
jgi:hypothetical protein